MKKIMISAVLLLTTVVLPSYTKKMAVKVTVGFYQSESSVRKDIGTAD
jgi:hypothetical protein